MELQPAPAGPSTSASRHDCSKKVGAPPTPTAFQEAFVFEGPPSPTCPRGAPAREILKGVASLLGPIAAVSLFLLAAPFCRSCIERSHPLASEARFSSTSPFGLCSVAFAVSLCLCLCLCPCLCLGLGLCLCPCRCSCRCRCRALCLGLCLGLSLSLSLSASAPVSVCLSFGVSASRWHLFRKIFRPRLRRGRVLFIFKKVKCLRPSFFPNPLFHPRI